MNQIKLHSINNNGRFTFRGVIDRSAYQVFREHYAPFLLLENVQINLQHEFKYVVRNHIAFTYTKELRRLGMLRHGDVIQFYAHWDDQHNYIDTTQHDYPLSRPTKIKILSSQITPHLPVPEDDLHALIGQIMEENKAYYLKTGCSYEKYYVDAYYRWQNTMHA